MIGRNEGKMLFPHIRTPAVTLIIVNNSIFPIALRLTKTPLEFWSSLEQ